MTTQPTTHPKRPQKNVYYTLHFLYTLSYKLQENISQFLHFLYILSFKLQENILQSLHFLYILPFKLQENISGSIHFWYILSFKLQENLSRPLHFLYILSYKLQEKTSHIAIHFLYILSFKLQENISQSYLYGKCTQACFERLYSPPPPPPKKKHMPIKPYPLFFTLRVHLHSTTMVLNSFQSPHILPYSVFLMSSIVLVITISVFEGHPSIIVGC
jgi:hypothetical protein